MEKICNYLNTNHVKNNSVDGTRKLSKLSVRCVERFVWIRISAFVIIYFIVYLLLITRWKLNVKLIHRIFFSMAIIPIEEIRM